MSLTRQLQLIALILGMSLSNIQAAPVTWADQIVVVVNKDVITQRDIEDISHQIRIHVPPAQLKKMDIQQVAINQLIQQRLLKQAAENLQVEITEKEIDNEILKLAEANHLSVETFYTKIEKEGVPKATLRNTIKDNLSVAHLAESLVQEQVKASPEEVNSLLQSRHLPLTEENKKQASNFIARSKQEQILASFAEEMKKKAYIEYRKKPY
ncbi:MAG: SurA N-terminal domain-containing protein [Neisseriaceae bacterium]